MFGCTQKSSDCPCLPLSPPPRKYTKRLSNCISAKKSEEIPNLELKVLKIKGRVKKSRGDTYETLGVFNYNRSNYFGADFKKKTGILESTPIPQQSGCDIFGLPQLDGVRSERRQYPEHHLRSNIMFGLSRPIGRVYMIDTSCRSQKRHYSLCNTRSYLDDYY